MEVVKWDINNQTNYPDKDIMELFLMIGNDLNVFWTLPMQLPWGKIENRYKYNNAVRIIAALCEYFAYPENESKKKDFLKYIKGETKEKVYKYMADTIMDIWLQKKQNEHTRQTIQLYKNKIGNRQEIEIRELPIVPEMIFPKRYEGKPNVLIDKLFQEKLEKEKNVQEGADQIQKDTESHIFMRQDNENNIDELKKML